MNFKNNKKHKNSLLTLLGVLSVMTLISILSFTGCKFGQATGEEPVISEPEEEETADTGAAEESSEEEEVEDTITGMEITGNINILSGLDISETVQDSRPIAVMVENSPDSRPQSGLIYADMVYEVVDEGGVTRSVAVFSSNDAEIIGPVRSARIYYAEIARSFDPIYTFWGTYPECYDVIKSLDMDVLDGNSDAYVQYTDSGWRDYSRIDVGEDTAHTAFMSTLKLKEDAAEYGYSLDGGQSPLRFKIDAVDSERGDISDINIVFSYDNFNVDFKYNKENNNYLKFTGGSPHTDYETGEQIAVNNIIVMITNIEGPIDASGHMVVRTTGTSDIGKAYFFMDGNVIEGTWERASVFDPFKYKDNDGNIILFNRGSTWVSLIQDTARLTY
jgi:hypothetical protein